MIYCAVMVFDIIDYDFDFDCTNIEVAEAFKKINKFFLKVKLSKLISIVPSLKILRKCILMPSILDDEEINFLTPCVDLNEHD